MNSYYNIFFFYNLRNPRIDFNVSHEWHEFRSFFSFPKGLAKFDVPTLDPYFTEQQRTLYENGDIRADITVRNVNTYGLAKARFLAVRPQYSDGFFKLEVDIDLPKIFMEGEYSVDGAVGAFKINGDGMQIT